MVELREMRALFLLGFVVSGVAFAQSVTIASTFGAGGSFSQNLGTAVNNSDGLAFPFTVPAAANYAFQSATLAVQSNSSLGGRVTVFLSQDNDGTPSGALPIEQFQVNPAPYLTTAVAVTVTSILQPVLQAGSTYWLCLEAEGSVGGIWLSAGVAPTPNLSAIALGLDGAFEPYPSPSNPGAFSVNAIPVTPVAESPSNGASGVSLLPTLTWTSSPLISYYNVYLGTSSPLPLVATTAGTSYTPTMLLPGKTYSWQVSAFDAFGFNPSTVSTFSTGSQVPSNPVIAPTGVGPGSGSGSGYQRFMFTFGDSNGSSDLSVLDVLINNYLDGEHACYFAFVPVSATDGYVYLVDDAGDGGYISGSPALLSTGGFLHNSQCSLDLPASFVSGSGNTLSLTMSIYFYSSFAGNKIFYTAARSSTQNSGWQAIGTWNVPYSLNGGPTGPTVTDMVPARTTATGGLYTFTFGDSNGYSDLAVLDVLTNSFLDGIGACYFAYVPISATNGYLYLVDDAGDGGYVTGSPMLLSSGGSLQNSQCTLNTSGASASASGNSVVGQFTGNSLTLTLPISFSHSFAGNQVFYLAARNNSGGNSGWQSAGSVTVP